MKSILATLLSVVMSTQLLAVGDCYTGDKDCDDGNACTNDLCTFDSGFVCVHGFNFDVTSRCCDPATGYTRILSDDDPCTLDVCDDNGGPVHIDITPDCGPGPTRVFFVPAGVDPVDVLLDPNFEHVVDAGTTLTIEAFVFLNDVAVRKILIQSRCDFLSDQTTAPAVQLVANSVVQDGSRLDWFGQDGAVVGVREQGSCGDLCPDPSLGSCGIPCIPSPDSCPGGTLCQLGVCSISPPILGIGSLVGPLSPSGPRYLGEMQYNIHEDAVGTYTFRPECCVNDADCDGVADGGCVVSFTILDYGITPLDIVIPLIVTIQTGDCLAGDTCTPDVTRTECENNLGGTFRPDGTCGCFDDTDCVDLNLCTTDTCADIGGQCPDGSQPDNNNCCRLDLIRAEFCCDPATARLVLRTDANACTIDTCDQNGEPVHEPIPGCDIGSPIPTLTPWGQATMMIVLTIALALTARRRTA